MATDKPLRIAYAGSLAFHEGKKKRGDHGFPLNLFLTYNHHATDPSTRSASFLFRAMARLRKNKTISFADLEFHLWGNIAPEYELQAKQLGIADLVKIGGFRSKSESIQLLEEADLLFLPMESASAEGKPLFIPGKAFEYMNAGKPILFLSGPCDCADVLRPSGLLAEFMPGDSEQIAAFLSGLIDDRELLNKFTPDKAYISRYSFRNITGQLAGVFDELLKHGK